jgi:lipid-binding SYLF domain-containing protein
LIEIYLRKYLFDEGRKRKMENRKQRYSIVTMAVLAVFVVGIFLASSTPPAMASDRGRVQLLVDKAEIALKDFMTDPNYAWLGEHIRDAKGILIFPQVIKGGFIWGGSGGTGVFLARDPRRGNWSDPAFYTIGSVTFGLQIGGEAAQVVMLAMTQRAIDSLLSSSVKLGGDVSVAIGPVGGGAQASAGIPDVTADFISFSKTKGLYAGLNLQGSVVAVRDRLNRAYYGKEVRPADIIVARAVSNRGADELRAILQKAA